MKSDEPILRITSCQVLDNEPERVAYFRTEQGFVSLLENYREGISQGIERALQEGRGPDVFDLPMDIPMEVRSKVLEVVLGETPDFDDSTLWASIAKRIREHCGLERPPPVRRPLRPIATLAAKRLPPWLVRHEDLGRRIKGELGRLNLSRSLGELADCVLEAIDWIDSLTRDDKPVCPEDDNVTRRFVLDVLRRLPAGTAHQTLLDTVDNALRKRFTPRAPSRHPYS